MAVDFHQATFCGPWTGPGRSCSSRVARQQEAPFGDFYSRGFKSACAIGVGSLASVVRALRRAGVEERKKRLRMECLAELRAICVGLRLNFGGSRAELVKRIENALSQDDELAAPEKPIGRLIKALNNLPGKVQAAGLLASRFKATDLKSLCRPLRLSTTGGKELLANRITEELGHRCTKPRGACTQPRRFPSRASQASQQVPQAPLEPEIIEPQSFSRQSQQSPSPSTSTWIHEDNVATAREIPDPEDDRLQRKHERHLRRRRRLAEILAEELSAVFGPAYAGATVPTNETF